MLAIHNHTMDEIVRKGTTIQGMLVYTPPEEQSDKDFENFVVVTALGAATSSNDLVSVEEKVREEVLDRYGLGLDVDISEVFGNLTIELNGKGFQENYILEYPFSELDSVELDTGFLKSCVSGCSCTDMSYLNKFIGCINTLDNEIYDFSFSEQNGCSDNKFEVHIYVSRVNNTWSSLFPHVLNQGSPIEFSC
jgi:hypothetical protein